MDSTPNPPPPPPPLHSTANDAYVEDSFNFCVLAHINAIYAWIYVAVILDSIFDFIDIIFIYLSVKYAPQINSLTQKTVY